MKLLLENWKKYLNEEQEEVEEGALGAAALGLALGAGAGTPAHAADTDTTQGTATTQQADAEKQAETGLQKNDDGSFSMDYSNPVTKGMAMSATWLKTILGQQGKVEMYNKLVDAGFDANSFNYSIVDVSMDSKTITLEATPK
jgi:hypothetical protein